jgi:hypothetical protein
MCAAIIHTIGGAEFRSDVRPESVEEACDLVFSAFRRREIPKVTLIHVWHHKMARWCALLGSGNPHAVADWALKQFRDAAKRKDQSLLDQLIAGGIQQLDRHVPPGASALWTMMHYLWSAGLLSLIKTNVNLDTPICPKRQTALHQLVLWNEPEVVKAMLVAGADPNLRDHYGWMPLHYAAAEAYPCIATVAALIAGGADLKARTPGREGRAPLRISRLYGNKALRALLAGRGENAA